MTDNCWRVASADAKFFDVKLLFCQSHNTVGSQTNVIYQFNLTSKHNTLKFNKFNKNSQRYCFQKQTSFKAWSLKTLCMHEDFQRFAFSGFFFLSDFLLIFVSHKSGNMRLLRNSNQHNSFWAITVRCQDNLLALAGSIFK